MQLDFNKYNQFTTTYAESNGGSDIRNYEDNAGQIGEHRTKLPVILLNAVTSPLHPKSP